MELRCTAERETRLLSILRRELQLSSTLVRRLKSCGAYTVNGEPAHTDRLVRPGDVVRVCLDEPRPDYPAEDGPLSILYEDEALLAVDKPQGMLVHPAVSRQTGTLANRLLGYYDRTAQACAVHPVSRLDRDTFGVVLLAKNADVVLLCMGLDEIKESEGIDRADMQLAQNQLDLLAAVAAVIPNVVVLLSAGSALDSDWGKDCKALGYGWLGGQAGAGALVEVLTGAQNPCGKLAETWARSYADTPAKEHFGGDGEMTQVLRDAGAAGLMGIEQAGGQAAFLSALQRYVEQNAGGVGTLEALEAALEAATGSDWSGYLADMLASCRAGRASRSSSAAQSRTDRIRFSMGLPSLSGVIRFRRRILPPAEWSERPHPTFRRRRTPRPPR